MRITVLLLLLVSCGVSQPKPVPLSPTHTVEAPVVPKGPFDKYTQQFAEENGTKVTTPIEFVSSLEVARALAVCRISATGEKIIQAVKSSFAKLEAENAEQAQYIIFHELGHCELGRPHTSQHLRDYPSLPYSIMFPTFPASFASFQQFRDHYYGELFGEPTLKSDGISFLAQPQFVGSCFFGLEGFKSGW
jgi:hypothetical protein